MTIRVNPCNPCYPWLPPSLHRSLTTAFTPDALLLQFIIPLQLLNVQSRPLDSLGLRGTKQRLDATVPLQRTQPVNRQVPRVDAIALGF